jgi:hypothetical protein
LHEATCNGRGPYEKNFESDLSFASPLTPVRKAEAGTARKQTRGGGIPDLG